MSPEVSVVIKSYNHVQFVAEAIESILNQSFQDFEIIITDDASTDGTPEIIKKYKDDRIKSIFHSKNQGISMAMNATVSRATGRYIAILNSDDYALPHRLEKQVEFLNSHPDYSLVFGLPLIVDESGHPTSGFNDFQRPLSFRNFQSSTWLNCFFFKGNCLAAPTAMIRKIAYESAGIYDPRLANLQDFDMWVRMLILDHNIFFMPEQLSAFRILNDFKNMSAPRTDTLLRSTFELIQILCRYRDIPLDRLLRIFEPDCSNLPAGILEKSGILLSYFGLATRDTPRVFFALQTLFDCADSEDEIRDLRSILGGVDVFNVMSLRKSQETVRLLQEQLKGFGVNRDSPF